MDVNGGFTFLGILGWAANLGSLLVYTFTQGRVVQAFSSELEAQP